MQDSTQGGSDRINSCEPSWLPTDSPVSVQGQSGCQGEVHDGTGAAVGCRSHGQQQDAQDTLCGPVQGGGFGARARCKTQEAAFAGCFRATFLTRNLTTNVK